MKQIKPHSLYALLAALGAHGAIILLFLLLFWYVSENISASPPLPKEQRVKLSLTENPTVPKEALVKNDIAKPAKTLPIPRGEQLNQEVAAVAEPPIPEPEVTQTSSSSESLPSDTQSSVHDSEERVEENHESRMIRELYGDVFTDLSAGEQKFILDNQETMRRITQNILGRYAPYRIPPGLELEESNMVEFYLHPDGSVTGLRFLHNSRYELLDNVTLETLGIAYKKYPRPQQPTLIRYRIDYVLGGN